jgi:thiamine pyrophosphate-dependent acetolactate synthase large subunit-like protein
MRDLISTFLNRGISRRDFVTRLAGFGLTASAVNSILEPLDAINTTPDTDSSLQTTFTGSGAELLIAQARAAGVEYLFTNPGSSEVAILDALVDDPQIHLIEGLHEGIVISMADGYHKLSQKPAFVNVHAIAGTAQMAGQLFNCSKDGSAIVVTAGLNDNEAWSDDVHLGPRPGFDQKDVNRQFTKLSWEARDPRSLAMMLRRAFKVAMTDPGGPVYLAVTSTALRKKDVTDIVLPAERFLLNTRIHADRAVVQKAAQLIMRAHRPVIIASDEVWKAGAQQQLLELSEMLSIPVAQPNRYNAFQNFPSQHPYFLDGWDPTNPYISRGPDLIIFVGSYDFGDGVVPVASELPSEARVVRLSMDPSAMGRDYPTDIALLSNVRTGLEDLIQILSSTSSKLRVGTVAEGRGEELRQLTSAEKKARDKEISGVLGRSPIHPSELGKVLAESLEKNAILVSENPTADYDLFPFGFRDNEMTYISMVGSSLGWGLGASTGVKLAAPDRQVVCSIGDGALMYSAAGFWTQARYRIPVLTVVSNNFSYQIVRQVAHQFNGRMAKAGKYPGTYLGDPEIDFVKLAESQGVSGERITSAAELRVALERATKATKDGRPYVIDARVACFGDGADSTWHDAFNLAAHRKRLI